MLNVETWTTLDGQHSNISDYWNVQKDADLDGEWLGHTKLSIRRPAPPPHHEWVMGRLTRVQKANRPPTWMPEDWTRLGKKLKEQAIAEWGK